MSLTISDPLHTGDGHEPGGSGPEQEQQPASAEPAPGTASEAAPGTGWLEGWTETWAEDDPEPVAAPRPAAPTVPLVGGAPAVPPTRRVALFAPIRAGTGRHRLSTAVRRRPGPLTAGLLVAATTLALGSLHSPQLPFCAHAAASGPVPVPAQVRG